MISNISHTHRYLKVVASGGRLVAARMRPTLAGRMLLPLAMAMCASHGASHVQAFVTKHRVMAAGIAPAGIVISDGEESFLVGEAELDALLTEVEHLS